MAATKIASQLNTRPRKTLGYTPRRETRRAPPRCNSRLTPASLGELSARYARISLAYIRRYILVTDVASLNARRDRLSRLRPKHRYHRAGAAVGNCHRARDTAFVAGWVSLAGLPAVAADHRPGCRPRLIAALEPADNLPLLPLGYDQRPWESLPKSGIWRRRARRASRKASGEDCGWRVRLGVLVGVLNDLGFRP